MKITDLAKLILKFALRRVDYLTKSLYYLIPVIVGEIAAITNAAGIQTVIDEFLRGESIPQSVYWPIRLLSAIFIGGDWAVLLSCVCLLAIVITLKVLSNKETPKVKHIFNNQIRTIKSILDEFKNETADKLCASALLAIEDSYLTKRERLSLSAQMYYLRGIARVRSNDSKQMFRYHIDAYILDKTDIKIKARAATSYFHMGDTVTAEKLATEIISSGQLNERAYAVRAAQRLQLDFSEIPESISKNPIFKVAYASLKRGHVLASLKTLLQEEIDKQPVPENISLEDVDYWVFVGEFALKYGLTAERFTLLEKPSNFADNLYLIYSRSLFVKLYNKTKKTEFLSVTSIGQAIQRYYLLLEYLMSASLNFALELRDAFVTEFTTSIDVDLFFVEQITIALLQTNQHADAFAFIQKYKIDNSIYHSLLEFMAAKGINNQEVVQNSFINYIGLLPVINENEVRHCIEYVNYLEQHNQLDKDNFLGSLLHKQFQNNSLNHLIRAYVFRHDESAQVQVVQDVGRVCEGYESLPTDFRYLTLVLLKLTGDWKTCNSLIEKYHDWKLESLPRTLFIENLMVHKERTDILLALLKHVRHEDPQPNYLRAELRMYVVLRNFDEIITVCKVGIKYYPTDANYIYFLIVSLYTTGQYDSLTALLKDDLLNQTFTWEQSITLATILIAREKETIGLKIAYAVTVSNYDIPLVKQQYFFLVTTQIKAQRTNYSKVELDTSVIIESEGKRHIIDINDRAVKSNYRAEALLGHAINDILIFEDHFTTTKIPCKVVGILDKYSALSLKISEEAASSPFSGMTMKAITLPDSPEQITKELIEHFGASGDSRKIKQDQAFLQYHAGEISFTDLFRVVSYTDPIDVLLFLFSKNSDGFVSIPKPMCSSEPSLSGKRFVVDLTVIPTLQKISKNLPGLFKEKFIISQFLLEHLRQEYRESIAKPDEQMTMEISTLGVKSSLYSKEHKEGRISFFETLISWVNDYCEVAYSTDRLQMTFNNPSLWRPDDWYFNYIIDTSFIAWNQILLSDDALYYKYFSGRFPMMGIECFIERTINSSSEYNEQLLTLLQCHYIGLTLTGKVLYNAFKKPHFGGPDIFANSLQALPFYRHYNSRVLYEVLEFAKLIYSDSIPNHARKAAVQAALVEAFKGQPYEQLKTLKEELNPMVNRIFHLLQTHIPSVSDDILTALQIGLMR
jgi:hypothetical protein